MSYIIHFGNVFEIDEVNYKLRELIMKKIFFSLFSLLVFCFTMNAKDIYEGQVPAKVKRYVAKHYPRAVDKEWKYKDKNHTFYYYKVQFEVGGREVKLELDTRGKLLKLKEELPVKDIPRSVKRYISKNFQDATILRSKKKIDHKVLTYDVRVVFNANNGYMYHRNIHFDAKGNVLRY